MEDHNCFTIVGTKISASRERYHILGSLQKLSHQVTGDLQSCWWSKYTSWNCGDVGTVSGLEVRGLDLSYYYYESRGSHAAHCNHEMAEIKVGFGMRRSQY